MPLLCAVIALLVAGAGGIPLPCKQDTICLKDFRDDFHRLKLICKNLTVDVEKTGAFLNPDVLYDPGSRCISWRSGILEFCSVTETNHHGKKMAVRFTYNCTAASETSTAPAPTPGNLTLTTRSPAPSAEDPKRHHTCAIAAAVVLPVVFLVFYLNCLQTIRDRSPGINFRPFSSPRKPQSGS